jgi:2-haloacid dehalogenase
MFQVLIFMMTQEHYKPVIVLDAGRVLVDINPGIVLDELSKRCEREIQLPHSRDLDTLFLPLYMGTRSGADILHTINQSLGLSLKAEEWRELWCRTLIGEVPGMREALSELMNDFRLVALSNTDEVHWTYALEKYPIFQLLDGWVVSYAEGMTKPNPAIYSAVVTRYCDGRPPFFYTDDSPQFVETARKLGWQAELFIDAEQFKEEVKRRRKKYLTTS